MGVPEPSPPFDHIVITRFSAVFLPDTEPVSEDWLYFRLAFFQDALLASMRGQIGAGPFTWLVWFDDRCSAGFRAEVDRLASDGLFTPVWTHEVVWAALPGVVAGATTGKEFLMTTRIDSDDAVSRDFIASIHARFDGSAPITYNFAQGLQVDRSGAVYRYSEPAGPFQTFVERRVPGVLPRTVFAGGEHFRARARGAVVEVQGPPMWLQVLHDTNIANQVRGVRASPRLLQERFSIDLPYRTNVSVRELLLDGIFSRLRLLAYWRVRPYYAFEAVDAVWGRMKGTRTLPYQRASQGPPFVHAVKTAREVLRARVSHVRGTSR